MHQIVEGSIIQTVLALMANRFFAVTASTRAMSRSGHSAPRWRSNLEEFVSRIGLSFLGKTTSSVLRFPSLPLTKGATLLITHCRTAKTTMPTGFSDRFGR